MANWNLANSYFHPCGMSSVIFPSCKFQPPRSAVIENSGGQGTSNLSVHTAAKVIVFSLCYYCECLKGVVSEVTSLFSVYFISPNRGSEKTETLVNQSINQYIYNAPWYSGACYSADYAEAKRNVLSRVLNVITDGAVRHTHIYTYKYTNIYVHIRIICVERDEKN